MRRLLLFITFLVSLVSFAGEVTEQEALWKAQQFMKGKQFKQKNLRRASAIGGPKSFYVFNADNNGGFVIVSADDRTEAILGYADQGTLDPNQLPENARKWLEGYAEQIKSLGYNTEKTASRRVLGSPVPPLITAHWNQGSPYNNMCPLDGEDRSVTGCVATAMAQVMYYHKWPTATVGPIPEYETSTKQIPVEELPATTFKWDKMKNEYDYDETGEAADAVAELMRYCGQAVQMDYKSSSSGAWVSAERMINIFGYSKTAKDVSRRDYTTTQWEQMMYNELKNRRPVLYSGASGTGGHQFVIDGYDDKGLFHVNWGWGGSSDGYFVLSILNPSGRGIGGGTSSNGYTIGQDAIIMLQQDHGEEAEPEEQEKVYCDLTIETSEFTRSSSNEDFSVDLKGSLHYWGDDDIIVDYAWALYQNGEQVKMFDIQENVKIRTGGYYAYVNQTVTFGKDLTDGTYEIRQLYRLSGTTEWKRSIPGWTSIMAAVIKGNTVTLMFADEIPDIVHVNSGTLTGDKKVGRPMKATLNWTNNGIDNETRFYLWLSNEKKYVGVVSSYINNGQTGDVEINFAPTAAGDITVTVTKDYQYDSKTGTYSYTSSDVVWTQKVTIEACTKQNLSVDMTIDGEKNGTIEGTTIDATVTFKNEGENAYNDNVIIRMVPIDDDWNYLEEWTEVIKPLSVAVGATNQVAVQFPNLKKEQKYYIQVYYYSVNESGKGYTVWGTSKTIIAGVVLVPQELDTSVKVTNANNDGTISGTTIKMDITLTNTGSNDYNDKIVVGAWYDGDDGYVYWEKDLIFNAEIAAGQTKKISNCQITDLTIGKEYCISISYYSENKLQRKFFWTYYTLKESTFIPGDANGDGEINVTDIVATVNYIMEKPSDGFNKEAADLNGDGVVNVTDIVMMVNIIMEAAARQEADVNKKEEKDNTNAEVGLSDIPQEGQVKY